MRIGSVTLPAGNMVLAVLTVAALFAGHLVMGAYSDAAGVQLAAAWALLFAIFGLRRETLALAGRQMLLWIALLCFVVVLALPVLQFFTVASVDHEYLLAAEVRLCGLLAALAIGVAIGQDQPARRLFVLVFLWMSILFAVLSIVLFAFGIDALNASEFLGLGRRLTATFFTPNTAALHFGFCAFLALAAVCARLSRAWRRDGRALDKIDHFLRRGWIELLSLGLSLICLGMTGSRMGLASAIVAVVIFAFLNVLVSRQRSKTGGRGQAIALALLIVVVIGGAIVTLARLADASQDLRIRAMIYQSHWPFAAHSGPIGFGFGSFHAVNRLATTPINFSVLSIIGGLHDVYLQWLEQAGIVGLAAMLATMILLMAALVRLIGRRGSTGVWAQAVLAMSVFAALHDLTDFGLEFYSMSSEWALILGLVLGMGLNAEITGAPKKTEAVRRFRVDVGNITSVTSNA